MFIHMKKKSGSATLQVWTDHMEWLLWVVSVYSLMCKQHVRSNKNVAGVDKAVLNDIQPKACKVINDHYSDFNLKCKYTELPNACSGVEK